MRHIWPALAAVSFAAAPAAAAAQKDGKAALSALTGAIAAHAHARSFDLQLKDGKPITGFADYTLADAQREAALRKGWLATLLRIDPASLDATTRESYEIVRFNLESATEGDADYWLTFDLTPYQAPMMIGMVNRVLASHPLGTPAEARDYARLVALYATMLDGLAAKLDAQEKRGIFMPKAVLPVVRSTWTTLAAGLDGLRPGAARLATLDTATRAKLLGDVDALVAKRLKPRIAGLIAAVGPAYEAKAPVAVGLAQYPGGKALYAQLVVRNTTLPMTPEQMRDIGLRDVGEIQGRMAAIRKQLGFDGTMRQYYDKISADPRFIAKSPEDLARIYDGYVARMAAKVPTYFQTLPKAPYGARRLPLEAEAGQTFGYYNPPTNSEPRGIYYFNASNLEKRSTINAEPIIFHELIPGHHFQIALQQESATLPPFRKNMYFGAFNEGWGEYASSLGIEAGLYDTPEALYGRYVNELFLTARLVVDSGMNYFGWPLEKARSYLRENTALSEPEIASETLRYSVNIPGQALAYHIGFATFWDLRHRAEKALGPKFDIREFHDVLLLPGARPMSVVAEDVDAYIARKKAG
jgi:uncharacterized protein (DUF885 family)